MSDGSNTRVLEAFQAAIGRGAWDDAAGLLTEDAVFHEAPSLPYGGDYRGAAGYRDLVDRCMALASFEFGSAPRYHETSDGLVVMISEFTIRGSKTGRSATTAFCEVYAFEAGRIADVLVFYFDEAAVVAALVD
jgi:ketosteroid isomerase-like protein